ncbi:MAG TPA: DNA repair protein RadC [Polyangiaceae bacterium]|nr:DNA repair protein RadC [Polyangiaceae bacterium]
MPDLRERILHSGVESLSDVELVTVLVGTGSAQAPAAEVARRLLDDNLGLEGLNRLTALGLAAHHGLGPAKAARVAAALELGRRSALRSAAARTTLSSFDAVAAWARPRLSALEHEEVWLLALDGRNGLKSARRIAQGGMHGCALTTRDVLAPALRDAASAIVLVHNHPSGDPRPSPEDVNMTSLVARACEVVGMHLLDHVIVARGGSASLLESGAMG